MAPRRAVGTVLPDVGLYRDDPLNAAVREDREGLADQLTDVLEGLGNIDQGSIKGILYRIPVPNGKYEWIREVFPPFDVSSLMSGLKEELGGGDYALRIMAENRVRKTIHFSIMKEKTALLAGNSTGSDTMMLMQMMMQQQAESSRQAMAAADRQMQMMMSSSQQSTQMMLGMVTAMMGGKDKTSEVMAAIAPLLTKNDGNNMQETLAMLTTAKTLFGDKADDNKFDADDLVGSAVKLGTPLIGALGRAFQQRGANGGTPGEVPATEAAPRLMLPSGAPAANGPETVSSGWPLLDLIREDVLFFYRRNHDPEKAADCVYDLIEAAEIPLEDLDALVSAVSVSPNWLEELAALGLDLRERPEWAKAFLDGLVSIHTDLEEQPDDSGRRGGHASVIAADGEAGKTGLDSNADTELSRTTDD